MKWLLIFISVISLKACDNYHDQKQNSMLDDTYNILTLNGKDVLEFNLSITFKDSTRQVFGFSGCNRFIGSYETIDNGLQFGTLGSTRMMCLPKLNDLEGKMLDALSKVNSFLVKDDTLMLLHKDSVLLEAKKQDLAISFEYNQHSRSSFQVIEINKKSISIQNKRNGSVIKVECTNTQWEKLIALIKTISIESVPNLEAPSKKRLYDGAAMATLKIINDGKSYITPTFDHGNPHPDIANLVKEILSIAQNIE